jgi:hypothetical protein
VTVQVPEPAAKLYGLSIALDVIADRAVDARFVRVEHDWEHLVALGAVLVKSIDPGSVTGTAERVWLLDAGATFLRAWARLDPDKAPGLVYEATVLEELVDATLDTPIPSR